MKNAFVTFLAAIMLLFASCAKNSSSYSNGDAHVSVYLTDGPSDYDKVLIDIEDVQVNFSNNADTGWQTVHVLHPGVYNLLDFRNGMDTLLASADFPAGKISQIRLILGANNSVVVGGVSSPLETPSAQQSGLKLNLDAQLSPGIDYNIALDFDAGRSIVVTGNNKFILKPVIRAYAKAQDGAIKGVIQPTNGAGWIYALQGSDTIASAKPDTVTGGFYIGGLSAGSYNVSVNAAGTLTDTSYTGITVNTGQATDIGTINLH